MITIFLVIWSTVIFFCYYLQRRPMMKLAKTIPGPKGYPIVGNALMFWGKPQDVFKSFIQAQEQFKRVMAIWIGPSLQVAVYDARDVEMLLKSSRTLEKADEYRFLKPWLGDSLLISTGSKFRHHKKLIMPSFGINNLKEFLTIFNDHVIQLVDRLQEKLNKDEFDIHPYLKLCTMNVLLETSLGVKKDTIGEKALIYGKAVEKLSKFAHMRVYKPWLRPEITFKFSKLKKDQDKYLKILRDLTTQVIIERQKEFSTIKQLEMETGEKIEKRAIFLDKLLEAKDEGSGFTDKDILDEVMTMMFAGQDTTTVSIGFTLSLLGIYQCYQDKVYAEIEQVFGKSDTHITYEQLQQLQYLEQVIQESWRLFPPIPMIGRKTNQDVKLETCTIPKNSTVGIIIMLLHRNRREFPHPNKFNPDNFLPERIKERNSYSFMPFSAGYRTCVGQKYAMLLIKVVLSQLLRKYKVEATKRPMDYILVAETTLKRKDGYLISLKPRDNNNNCKSNTSSNKVNGNKPNGHNFSSNNLSNNFRSKNISSNHSNNNNDSQKQPR